MMHEVVNQAIKALILEAALTPKPGLVDAADNGAHTDMDFELFIDSALCFKESFEAYYQVGFEHASNPKYVFNKIRVIGLNAEETMFRTTKGVNTHKGANFSFGVVLSAIGACQAQQNTDLVSIIAYVMAMTKGLTEKELTSLKSYQTHGEHMYHQFGILGIRGEVEHGFPLIMHEALPYLKKNKHLPPRQRQLGVLLHLMAKNDDSNILKRGGMEALSYTQHEAKRILNRPPAQFEHELEVLNREFKSRNLSPGGSADLLALTLFFDMIETSL
ncbi:triphosphoribosyl-dephospho-CoA synthase CitG [Erysipelothrix larvae]|nr:triphosphoribosyl-dephospho-CoA synthase CitG [Erysipelothrix larvae]